MRIDSRNNPDVTRVEYTPIVEDAKVMITHLKLTMNQIIADLARVSDINKDPQIKRLCAIGITQLEIGTVMAVKALTSEGLVLRTPSPLESSEVKVEEKKGA